MSEQNAIRNRGSTGIEVGAWIAAGAGAAIWIVAGFFLMDEMKSYRPDPAVPLGWMSLGQWVATVAVVPAILLSGIRALLPDNRIG